MAIKLDCPRCKAPLKVPNKLAGGYTYCPQCRGRLWVAGDSTSVAPPPADAGEDLTGDPAADADVASSPRPAVAPLAPAPMPPPPPKKVARFVAAEAADSTLQLAPDGRLPQLRLEEAGAAGKTEAKPKSANPLLVFCALSASIVLSVALVLFDSPSPTDSEALQKAAMRRKIENHYFGSENINNKDLEPYQVLLREAQRAYSRGDRKTQRENYRRVLDMLRAERGSRERGLTGSRTRDKELEQAIAVLLRGG